jgi:hypothetical protein
MAEGEVGAGVAAVKEKIMFILIVRHCARLDARSSARGTKYLSGQPPFTPFQSSRAAPASFCSSAMRGTIARRPIHTTGISPFFAAA